LEAQLEEMLDYSAELSMGNLSAQQPPKDNLLCASFKNMNATLNHLTWQAKQVAAGDYSQRVSYLGEFSDAFNAMTAQLKEREEKLLQETAAAQQRSEAIAIYNELLLKMTANRLEWIVVLDAQSRDVVYCNRHISAHAALKSAPCPCCQQCHPAREQVFSWQGTAQEVWHLSPIEGRYFLLNSYPVDWHGRNAFVHVVTDITQQQQEKANLSSKAYFDPVTSIHNRVFFEEYMDQVLRDGETVTLGYLDLDGLKYVNDNYGHTEGDHYISTFATLVRQSFRRDDVFARVGGDEFCIILRGALRDLTRGKLETVRQQLSARNDKPYPMSFSYGIYLIDGSQDHRSLETILQEVDSRMYAYKRENKRTRI
jgi:diguanylate cyclase (GGDEF)-like protein